MDQVPQHKARYPESDRSDSGELSCYHWNKQFLQSTKIAQTQRATINKWELMEMKCLCMGKKGHHRPDKAAGFRTGKNIYWLQSDKWLISKI